MHVEVFIVCLLAVVLAGCGRGHSDYLLSPDYELHFIEEEYPHGHISAQVAVDLDNDSYLDLVVRSGKSGPGEIAWYRNPGSTDGNWKKYLIAQVGYPSGSKSSGSGLASFDVDGDGLEDIIAGASVDGIGNGLFWWRSPDDPTTEHWERHKIAGPDPRTGEEFAPHDIALGDVSGDGRIDLVLGGSSNQGTWWSEIPRDPKPAEAWLLKQIGGPRAMAYAGLATGDIDNDGRIDVVRSDIWYRAVGKASSLAWEPRAYGLLNTPPSNIRLADLSQDGLLEIVVSSGHSDSNGKIFWYSRHGDPTQAWVPHLVADHLAGPESLLVQVFESGRVTIVTAELDFANKRERPSVVVYETNSADDGQWTEEILLRGLRLRQLEQADINQDGKLDLYGVTFADDDGIAKIVWLQRR